MSDIGVIYIARGADPNWQQRVGRFAKSWHAHPPGIDCTLYVAFKEFATTGNLLVAFSALLPLNPIALTQDMAVNRFGGGVFQDACAHVTEPLICTLVSTTEIMHDDWLRKLKVVYDLRGAGLVGCTGSKEGNLHIRDTAIIIAKDLYLGVSKQFDFDKS